MSPVDAYAPPPKHRANSLIAAPRAITSIQIMRHGSTARRAPSTSRQLVRHLAVGGLSFLEQDMQEGRGGSAKARCLPPCRIVSAAIGSPAVPRTMPAPGTL